MMIKMASCFVLACSVLLSGCAVDTTEVDPTQGEDTLAPMADENGVWTKVTDGVWERTRPNDAQEEYVFGVPGMTWKVQQQQQALDAFQESVGSSSGEELSEEQQKTLKILEENLAATEKALVDLSSQDAMETSAPTLQPEYYVSGVLLGSCADYLVAGPTSGTGANAYASIDPQCPSFYLSAYVQANGLAGGISSSSGSRGVSATISNGTSNCVSQAYAAANGWGHTLTYPYCI